MNESQKQYLVAWIALILGVLIGLSGSVNADVQTPVLAKYNTFGGHLQYSWFINDSLFLISNNGFLEINGSKIVTNPMTATLNMGENEITNITKLSNPDGSAIQQGTSGTNLTDADLAITIISASTIPAGEPTFIRIANNRFGAIDQSGESNRANVRDRSFLFISTLGKTNASNLTNCTIQQNLLNIPIASHVDCDTEGTGVDVIIGDDFIVGGDITLKDTDGEFHDFSRELEILDELKDETLIVRINSSLSNTNFSIVQFTNKSLIVNFKEVNYDLGTSTDSILILNGSNSTPNFNHIYYGNGGATPTLQISTSVQDEVANVMKGVFGSNGYDLGSFVDNAQQYEFTKGVYERLFDEGAIYIDGFDIDATTTKINFSSGNMKIIISKEGLSAHDTIDGYNHIHSNGSFHQHSDFDGLDEYGTGESISNNKYFNVVFGIANTLDEVGQLYAVVQDLPSTGEYITIVGAETDSANSINFFPNQNFIKQIYIPLARGVMQNNGGVMTLQTLSNGELFIDIRGTVTASAGTSPSPGITVHSDLSNLDFSSSGHSGFAKSGDCSSGLVVQNITDSGVECIVDQDTTYTADAPISLTGTIFGFIACPDSEFYIYNSTSAAWECGSAGAGSVTSVAAGNGLDFTTITSTGSITMGTPGTLSDSTSNVVTATSHTHDVDDVYVLNNGDIMTGDLTLDESSLNMDDNNKICMNSNCSSWICHNGSALILNNGADGVTC